MLSFSFPFSMHSFLRLKKINLWKQSLFSLHYWKPREQRQLFQLFIVTWACYRNTIKYKQAEVILQWSNLYSEWWKIMSPEKGQFKMKRDNKQYTTEEMGGFVIFGKVHSEWINDTQGYNRMTCTEVRVASFKELKVTSYTPINLLITKSSRSKQF